MVNGCLVGGTGLEPNAVNPDKNRTLDSGINASAANSGAFLGLISLDADVRGLIARWPMLSEEARVKILLLAR